MKTSPYFQRIDPIILEKYKTIYLHAKELILFVPDEVEEFWEDLKNLVINTYEKNGNKPVSFIVHSMGALMVSKFLHQQTQEFKNKYINSMISLAGVYGGSVKAMEVFVDGKTYSILFFQINHS